MTKIEKYLRSLTNEDLLKINNEFLESDKNDSICKSYCLLHDMLKEDFDEQYIHESLLAEEYFYKEVARRYFCTVAAREEFDPDDMDTYPEEGEYIVELFEDTHEKVVAYFTPDNTWIFNNEDVTYDVLRYSEIS